MRLTEMRYRTLARFRDNVHIRNASDERTRCIKHHIANRCPATVFLFEHAIGAHSKPIHLIKQERRELVLPDR